MAAESEMQANCIKDVMLLAARLSIVWLPLASGKGLEFI
jgi:hypothetical protein